MAKNSQRVRVVNGRQKSDSWRSLSFYPEHSINALEILSKPVMFPSLRYRNSILSATPRKRGGEERQFSAGTITTQCKATVPRSRENKGDGKK